MDDLSTTPTTPPESEVKKLELDAEAILKQIEDFFAHLIHHHPDKCEALKAAQVTVTAAVNPIPAAPVAGAASASAPTSTSAPAASITAEPGAA